MKPPAIKHKDLVDIAWDAWCVVSLIGIWPRFIEPNLLATTKLTLKIQNLPDALAGFKILHFSDIHMHPGVSNLFLNKLIKKIRQLTPDLIACTGDFLCYARFPDKTRLKNLLCSLSAPYGCYAIFGNHDYQESVSINEHGDYDVLTAPGSTIAKGFSRLFSTIKLTKTVTEQAQKIGVNLELVELIKDTPFELLHNECKKIPIKDACLNICGLGEYSLGKCRPGIAFKTYDVNSPGIVLTHNPDSVPMLADFPGDVILCGHTHGGQINLPWFWKKFTLLENMQFKKGLFRIQNKWLYVNRGVGSVMPFRWFALPEIALITLEKDNGTTKKY
jgi:uncharacterized protein